MAERKDKSPGTKPPQRVVTSPAESVEDRIVTFAEELGRIAGTVQGKAEGWLESAALNDQLTRVRDGAVDLLNRLATASGAAAAAAAKARARSSNPAAAAGRSGGTNRAAATGRSGGKVDAPGKKHRKPPASTRGVKHSDETIAKTKGAQTLRRGNRRG